MDYSDKDILVGLNDLIANIDPTLKQNIASLENAEEIVQHLEETDDSFHRNDFVKYICDAISSEMGAIIDEEIERKTNSFDPNSVSKQQTLVQAVTDSVIKNNVYSNLSKQICSTTISASNELCKHIEKEMNASTDDETESHLSKQMRSMCSEGELSYGSSFNQGMFFMTQEQFHRIAYELHVNQPIEKRREALLRLCQVPPSDVMASESWTQLRVALLDALADEDTFISHTALTFHAKMFAVSSYQIMRETYTCLSEHLSICFKLWANQSSDEINLTNPVAARILQRLRLVNEFQCEVPLIWVRYPESFLDCIMDSTFDLITVFGKSKSHSEISVIHFLSLLDLEANWFRRWLHGNYSRAVVIKCMENKYRIFLVEAVTNCVLFCRKSIGWSAAGQSQFQQAKRQVYTLAHLQYTCFVHCLSIIARLLMYSCGRQLFPVQFQSQLITIQELLVAWIKLLSLGEVKPKPGSKIFEPAAVVGKALCNLCSSNAFVEECVNSDVISILLTPVHTWLDVSSKQRAKEATMLHIAEILASLTSTHSGRKQLLQVNSADNRTAAHVVAEFALKALSGKLHGVSSHLVAPSNAITGAFVFVCRQLYNTCGGLLLLHDYQLHSKIAASWRQTNENKQAPSSQAEVTFESESLPTQSSSRSLIVWEDTLLDNLLNFAATPQGLLMLQQTGAMNECVAYMHSRYTKKLQVSKCEKFGYGVMVTQLASTSAGSMALEKAGFIQAIVHEFWASVEGINVDIQHPAPFTKLSPVEKSVHKAFTGLANVLSSYQAVHQLFKGKQLPNKSNYTFRDIPDSPLELLDRIIALNSDQKFHALFNFEQSHVFGLRLLTLLSCNLDTWLLLETQYNIKQMLLNLQKNNQMYEGGVIIDELSIERNHLLVRTQLVGGDGERLLPTRTLHNGGSSAKDRLKHGKQEPFAWPLFYQFPVPKAYQLQVNEQFSLKKETALSRFLNKTKLVDKNRQWLEQLRTVFVKVIMTSPSTLRGGVLNEILEKSVAAQERMPEERIFKKSNFQGQSKKEHLPSFPSPVQVLGAKIAVQYGRNLNVLKGNADTTYNNLLHVLQTTLQHLVPQQTYSQSSKMICGCYPCHDWFASTVFLMFSGNKDKTTNLLIKMSEILVSGFLWPARLHASSHLSDDVRLSAILPLYYCTGHHVEHIVQSELPLIYSAFRMSGYTPSQITQHWLTQCFWNYLPWLQIMHYVTVSMVMGTDYQVYFCVSILKHLQHSILVHRQTQDLQVFLKENPIKKFVVGEWMEYMQGLEKKYREVVLSSMRSITR